MFIIMPTQTDNAVGEKDKMKILFKNYCTGLTVDVALFLFLNDDDDNKSLLFNCRYENKTGIMLAALHGKNNIIVDLCNDYDLHKIADLSLSDKNGKTVVDYIIEKNKDWESIRDVMDLLLKSGKCKVSNESTKLMYEKIKLQYPLPLNIVKNKPTYAWMTDDNGNEILKKINEWEIELDKFRNACINGNTNIVTKLLGKNAKVDGFSTEKRQAMLNEPDIKKETVLTHAIKQNRHEIVKILVNNDDIDLTVKTGSGTAFDVAVKREKWNCAKTLFQSKTLFRQSKTFDQISRDTIDSMLNMLDEKNSSKNSSRPFESLKM